MLIKEPFMTFTLFDPFFTDSTLGGTNAHKLNKAIAMLFSINI